MFNKVIINLIICFVFSSSILQAKQRINNFNAYTTKNVVMRAIIFPGWGQRYNGQIVKGNILGSITIVSALGAYVFYRQSENTYKDYENLGLKNGSLYDDYRTQANNSAVCSYVAAGVWLFSVLDAYFVSRGVISDDLDLRRKKVKIDCDKNTVKLTYQKKF